MPLPSSLRCQHCNRGYWRRYFLEHNRDAPASEDQAVAEHLVIGFLKTSPFSFLCHLTLLPFSLPERFGCELGVFGWELF